METTAAVAAMNELGYTGSLEYKKGLWYACRDKATAACKDFQDKLCDAYVGIVKGNSTTLWETYIKWNMGAAGSKEILDALAAGEMVTNPVRISKMDNQAWASHGYKSNGDPKIFVNGLKWWIKNQGRDPDEPV